VQLFTLELPLHFKKILMSEALRLRCVFAVLMSLLMTLLMSAWVTWLNIGLHPDFLLRWRHAFLAAWPVAFCAVMLCAPAVQQASRVIVLRTLRIKRAS